MPSQHPWSCRNIGVHPKIPELSVSLDINPAILNKPVPKLLEKDASSCTSTSSTSNSRKSKPTTLLNKTSPFTRSVEKDWDTLLDMPEITGPNDLIQLSKRFLSDRKRAPASESKFKVAFKQWLSKSPSELSSSRRISAGLQPDKKRYKHFAKPLTSSAEVNTSTRAHSPLSAERSKENVKLAMTHLEDYLYQTTVTEPETSHSISKETKMVDTVMSMVDPILNTSENDKPSLFLQPEEDAPAELLDYIETHLGIPLDSTNIKGWPNLKPWPVPMMAASIRTRRFKELDFPIEDFFVSHESNTSKRAKGGPWYLPKEYWFHPLPKVALSKYSQIRLEQEFLMEQRASSKKNSLSNRLQQLTQKSKNEYLQLEAKYGLSEYQTPKLNGENKDGGTL